MVKNLRRLRQANGISQQKLAEYLHLSQQAVHKYETSSNEPSIGTLCALATYFGTSIDYIVGRTSDQGEAEEYSPETALQRKRFIEMIRDLNETCDQLIDAGVL